METSWTNCINHTTLAKSIWLYFIVLCGCTSFVASMHFFVTFTRWSELQKLKWGIISSLLGSNYFHTFLKSFRYFFEVNLTFDGIYFVWKCTLTAQNLESFSFLYCCIAWLRSSFPGNFINQFFRTSVRNPGGPNGLLAKQQLSSLVLEG